MTCCNIFDAFDEQNNLIKEYQHWKLLVRNRNTTLGNCVAITKRHMGAFSEITSEEMEEFAQVVKDVEKALKKSFSYDKINYQMLMMKDTHTHFHITPKYATVQETSPEWSGLTMDGHTYLLPKLVTKSRFHKAFCGKLKMK